MLSLTRDPSPASGIRLGARPTAARTLHLAANGAPEFQRGKLLSEFFERLGVRYDTEPVGSAPIEIDIKLHALPGLQIMTGKMQGARYRRTGEKKGSTEDVGLLVYPRGTHLVAQRGREVELSDGDATLVPVTESQDTTHGPPGGVLALRFPMPQLAARLAGAQNCFLRRIPRDTLALRLLTGYVDVVRNEQTPANGDLPHSIVSHFYDLLAAAIGATRDTAEMAQGGLRAARLHAIKQDIARHLDQPDLSVAALAFRHGCTPRFVQRLFESEGTSFTDYVLAQRIARAHQMLTDPRRDGEKISTIAYDAGFADVSYFNRVFRQRYGDTPSGIRVLARRAIPG